MSAMESASGGLSIQAQLELNDIPEFANEPGPGHYFGPESCGFSSLGPQKFSKNQSAPDISLPRTGWDNWEKVLVSNIHSMSYLGRESPGAAYDVPSGLSKKSAKIGTSLRPSLSVVDPHGSPGPMYNVRETPGQSIGDGVNEPENRRGKGFGKAFRFGTTKGGQVGPGEYPRKDGALNLGSGKSIGTGRSSWEKVITPGWEVEGRCRASPGPGAPLWSNIKTGGSRSFSCGRAERFSKMETSQSPGPGQYKRDERDVSRGRQHLSDTRTPVQVSFGSKPKKPRFRQLLAMQTANNAGWGYF